MHGGVLVQLLLLRETAYLKRVFPNTTKERIGTRKWTDMLV